MTDSTPVQVTAQEIVADYIQKKINANLSTRNLLIHIPITKINNSADFGIQLRRPISEDYRADLDSVPDFPQIYAKGETVFTPVKARVRVDVFELLVAVGTPQDATKRMSVLSADLADKVEDKMIDFVYTEITKMLKDEEHHGISSKKVNSWKAVDGGELDLDKGGYDQFVRQIRIRSGKNPQLCLLGEKIERDLYNSFAGAIRCNFGYSDGAACIGDGINLPGLTKAYHDEKMEDNELWMLNTEKLDLCTPDKEWEIGIEVENGQAYIYVQRNFALRCMQRNAHGYATNKRKGDDGE